VRYEFQKGIPAHNETLSITAMRIGDQDRSSFTLDC
jgi:hypothetical protein